MANTTVNIDVKVQSKSLGQLEDDLAGINEELKQVEVGSDAFKKLSKQSQALNKDITKINNTIDGFTLDDKLQAADGTIKTLGGGVAAFVGTLGVLGVESEVFTEMEKKAASAIAVAVGFKDISEGITRDLIPALKKAGIGAQAFSATTRKALIATGIGAFIVALGTVIAYWDDIVDYFDDGTKSAELLNQELEDTKSISEGTYSVLESQRDLLEGRGESTAEVNKQLLNQLEIQIGITEQMILQKQLELDEEKAENRKVSFWEKMKIGAAGYFQLYGAQGKAIIEANEEESESTREKQADIFNLQTNLNKLKLTQLGLEGQIATQAEMAAGPQTALAVATQGVVDATVAYGDTLALNAPKIDANAAAGLKKLAADNESAATTKKNEELEYARGEALYASGQALTALGGILDQESAAAKALAIGGAIINTYLGVTEVLKQKSTLPSPFDVITKVANVAVVLASGFKAVQAIKSTPVKATSANMTPISPSNGRRGETPQNVQAQVPQFETVAPTMKTYVLAGDVTSAQEADAKLSRKRTLG